MLNKRIFKLLPKELMECARCHQGLPLSEFYVNKRYKLGYKTTCIKCNNEVRQLSYPNIAKKSAKLQRDLRKNHKLKVRGYRYKMNYGITIEDYFEMYDRQDGNCEICGRHFDRLNVDHCHTTNEVRSLLCSGCNKMIGFAKENVKTLSNAIDYINKHSSIGMQNITTSKAG